MYKKLKNLKSFSLTYVFLSIIAAIACIILNMYIPAVREFFENKLYIYIIVGSFTIINSLLIAFIISFTDKESRKLHINISNTLGADISEAYAFGGIGIISYSDSFEIVWNSDIFEARQISLLGKNIFNLFPKLKNVFNDMTNNEDNITCKVSLGQQLYQVLVIKELNILILKDITEVEALYESSKMNAPVVMTLVLDNLLDIVNVVQEDSYVVIEQQIRNTILDWAKNNNILIRKIKEDVYIAFLTEEIYEKVKDEKFKVIQAVSDINIEHNSDIEFTISLGIGRGSQDFIKIAELSANAIDIALSRGGNQVVENNYGSHVEFYGSSSENNSKRNILRTKMRAQSFGALIPTYNNFLIVPHENADFDAIGAALGMYQIVSRKGATTNIVCDLRQMEIKTRGLVKSSFDKEEIPNFFISKTRAMELLNDQTLVIVVDVHRPVMTTCPNVISAAKNIAVIDHHRRAADCVDDTVFNLIDPDSSSASEIVALFASLQRHKVTFTPRVATFLLTGILLDTGNLKARVSFNTYDAMMVLKESGADNVIAEENLKDEFEEYKLKTKIMSTTIVPYTGIYLATVPEDIVTTETMIAKAASEAFNVRGVKAMFVIGKVSKDGDQFIKVSARSDGEINVQLILEKLGGGGHYSAAAAAFRKPETIESVKDKIIETLELYKNEIKNEI